MPGPVLTILFCLLLAGAGPVAAQNATAPGIEITRLQPDEKELLDEGTQLQQQKNPARAMAVFMDLLRYYPGSKNQEEVLYRVSACYRDLGHFDDACQTLDLLGQKFPKGDWLGPGNLLRGEMLAADKKWEAAITPLQVAAACKLPEVQIRAHYLMVLACENLKKLPAARPSLEFLVKVTQDNPHLNYARLKLAVVEADNGNQDRAAELFKTLLAGAQDTDLRAEAAVRAGNLAYVRKQYRDAAGYYEVVRRTEAPEFWKKLAHLGLIQSYFAAGDYATVADVFHAVRPAFPEAAQAEVLFLTAEALRLTRNGKEALELYQNVTDQFPKDNLAEASAWARINILKAQNAEQLMSESKNFIDRYPKSDRIGMVQTMRADALFSKNDYKNAANAYAEAIKHPELESSLNKNDLGYLYYRTAYSFFIIKDNESALAWFKQYLARFPDHGVTAAVLWLKGQAEQQLKKPDEALQSWARLIGLDARFQYRELLLWQAALLAETQKRADLTEAWLGKLLVEFPNTRHLAEAHAILAALRQDARDSAGAMPHWLEARRVDAAVYYGQATQQIISILLQEKNLDGLRKELSGYDAWRQKNPTAPAVALEVYEWAGEQLQGGTEAAAAEAYFRRVLAGSQDRAQRKRVQLRLALLMSQLRNNGAAIREWKAYRVNFPEDSNRSGVLEPLAKACIGAADYELADKLAQQILEQNPEGEYNARGRLLLGEIAFAKKDYAGAAKVFSAVSLLMDDPVLTPLALARAEQAWRRAGDESKADEQLLRLKKQYPDYRGPDPAN